MTDTLRPIRSEGLELNDVADGLVVYQAHPERVHYLNNVSAVIFEVCDGQRTIEEIAAEVQRLFALDEPPIDEVRTCIADLVDKGVLQ